MESAMSSASNYSLFLENMKLELELEENLPTEKSYKCDLCSKEFAKSVYLKKHRFFIHSCERNYKCQECGEVFTAKCSLRRHAYRHTNLFQCFICHKNFAGERNLNNHFRVHTKERPHCCPTCGQAFSAVSGMKSHMRVRHPNPEAEKERYRCDICGKVFTTRDKIRMHLKGVHCNRDFACNMCKKSFKNKKYLVFHKQMVHEKVRPFICLKCNARFGKKSHLDYHAKKVHSGKTPFSCKVCKCKFSVKGALNAHMSTHSKRS